MGRARIFAVAAAAAFVGVVLLSPASARAEIESDLVKQGIAAYNDLEYAKAVDLLDKALQDSLTREEKVVTYQTLAYSHVALGDNDAAVDDFTKLLTVNGNFELDRTISPRIRAVFEKAQAKVATSSDAGAFDASGRALPRLTPKVTPTGKIKEGTALTIAGAYPGGVASMAQLFYRTRGQPAFSRVNARVDDAGRFSVTISGMHVKAPAVEYYLVLLDDSGSSVAIAGTLGRPLAVDVEALKKPVYARGWFWGVLGGIAVVGAGVATAVVLTTKSSITASTPASVSIMAH